MTDTNSIIVNINNNEEIDEFDKLAYVLGDDMTFPRASIDAKLLKLQKEVTEFVTSVILKHEKDFYDLIRIHFPENMEEILGSTNPSIISMITEITNIFYNKIYYDIQHKNNTPIANTILDMCELVDYGPHILLDKLIRLTFDAHIDVVREQLAFKNNDLDLYHKSVLNQINIYLSSKNLLHILSKGTDEDGPFVDLPEGLSAFNIVIDKNINPYEYV